MAEERNKTDEYDSLDEYGVWVKSGIEDLDAETEDYQLNDVPDSLEFDSEIDTDTEVLSEDDFELTTGLSEEEEALLGDLEQEVAQDPVMSDTTEDSPMSDKENQDTGLDETLTEESEEVSIEIPDFNDFDVDDASNSSDDADLEDQLADLDLDSIPEDGEISLNLSLEDDEDQVYLEEEELQLNLDDDTEKILLDDFDQNDDNLDDEDIVIPGLDDLDDLSDEETEILNMGGMDELEEVNPDSVNLDEENPEEENPAPIPEPIKADSEDASVDEEFSISGGDLEDFEDEEISFDEIDEFEEEGVPNIEDEIEEISLDTFEAEQEDDDSSEQQETDQEMNTSDSLPDFDEEFLDLDDDDILNSEEKSESEELGSTNLDLAILDEAAATTSGMDDEIDLDAYEKDLAAGEISLEDENTEQGVEASESSPNEENTGNQEDEVDSSLQSEVDSEEHLPGAEDSEDLSIEDINEPDYSEDLPELEDFDDVEAFTGSLSNEAPETDHPDSDPLLDMDSDTEPEEPLESDDDQLEDINITSELDDSVLDESDDFGESTPEIDIIEVGSQQGKHDKVQVDPGSSILSAIERELSAIKGELTSLRADLKTLRSQEQSLTEAIQQKKSELLPPQTPEEPSYDIVFEQTEEPDASDSTEQYEEFSMDEESTGGIDTSGGFFEEEEDETIALTGDELDNILNTAEFTEEPGKPSDYDEEIDRQIDDEIIGAPENQSFSEESPSELEETDQEDLSGQVVGEITLEPVEDEDHHTDEDPFKGSDDEVRAMAEMDIEKELKDIEDLDDDSIEFDFDDSDLEDMTIEIPHDMAEEETDDEQIEIDAHEDASLSSEDFAEQGSSIDDDYDESMVDNEPGESGSSDALIDSHEDSDSFGLPQDTNDNITEEPSRETGEADRRNPVYESESDDMSSSLKQEIKTVLAYMDKLLEALPEEKIEEFARSEHFETYKRLFEELGL